MVMSFNQRPQFRDSSNGIWRRLLLIDFAVQIPDSQKVKGMDKVQFWRRSGELPGMLNWAIDGARRLYWQGDFTRSEAMQQRLVSYKQDMNPIMQFCSEMIEEEEGSQLICKDVYRAYSNWCQENGYKPMAVNRFGIEFKKIYRKSTRKKARVMGTLTWVYSNLTFSEPQSEWS